MAFGYTIGTDGVPMRQTLPPASMEGDLRSIIGKWPLHPIWCGVLRLDPKTPPLIVASEVAGYVSTFPKYANVTAPKILEACKKLLGVP